MSVEWDILEVPAIRNVKYYTCCDEPYLDITFNVTMRRKTLFYTVNLIIPCMGISFLTVLVFYLPSDSGEKVSNQQANKKSCRLKQSVCIRCIQWCTFLQGIVEYITSDCIYWEAGCCSYIQYIHCTVISVPAFFMSHSFVVSQIQLMAWCILSQSFFPDEEYGTFSC